MKGRTRGVVTDVALLSRWAWFLIEAQRHNGLTQTAIANFAETKPCNLSAFINSFGKVRNVSPEKLTRILFAAGVHPDGLLTPGLHRWDTAGLPSGYGSVMLDLLRRNNLDCESILVALYELNSDQCLLIAKCNRTTHLMVMLRRQAARRVAKLFGQQIISNTDSALTSELQTVWQIAAPWLAERIVNQLLTPPQPETARSEG